MALAAPAACLSPTQITVRVETDMTCGTADGELEKVFVGTGGGQSTSVDLSAPCTDGFVGSVTIVPGKSADTVDIDVVGRLQGAKCDLSSANGAGCVVAKRRLSFIDHLPLTITIKLESECASVECPGNQTCQAGVCVDPQCTTNCSDAGDGGTTPRATLLTAGGDATCAGDGNGKWACWGDSTSGKLFATGNIGTTLIPQLDGAKRVVLGRAHGCATFPDPNLGDVVKCWGASDRFQAGGADGSGTVAKPSPIFDTNGVTLAGVLDLAAGDDFTCAITAKKEVVCWGAADVGQIGIVKQPGTPKAYPVQGVSGATALAAGAQHACALASLGNTPVAGVVCWGLNKDDQCSVPAGSPANPRQVAITGRAVYAGGNRSLVRRFGDVNTTQSELWGWGLGTGSVPSSAVPARIGSYTQVLGASSGYDHACVLEGVRPACASGDGSFMGSFGSTVPNATAFSTVVSGHDHACALTAKTGQVWCWGKNNALQLGGAKATNPNRVNLGL